MPAAPSHTPRPSPRLPCAVLIALCLAACQRGAEPPTAAKQTPSAPRLQIDPRLSIADNNGTIRFDGVVADAGTRSAIEAALLAAYGKGRAAGAIDVDAGARPATWSAGLKTFLDAFATVRGGSLLFEGDRIVLNGPLDPAQRRALRDAAERAFPGARLEGLFVPPAEAENVGTAKLSPEALASTLNTLPVRFKSGSGEVSEDSLSLVAEAADAIRSAPPGTRLLIVGPVLPSSDTGHDVFLSKQRAEAIKVQLVLNGIAPTAIETRGWGQNPDGTPVEKAVPPSGGAPMRFELLR
jgi:outer membrane protein OmpA-like peptidoglycan-associated protein